MEQGDATGQLNLGWMNAEGRGVTRDDKDAVTWHRSAAEQGNQHGQAGVGVMYAEGWGITQDEPEAANVNDVVEGNSLLHGCESDVFADAGYKGPTSGLAPRKK